MTYETDLSDNSSNTEDGTQKNYRLNEGSSVQPIPSIDEQARSKIAQKVSKPKTRDQEGNSLYKERLLFASVLFERPRLFRLGLYAVIAVIAFFALQALIGFGEKQFVAFENTLPKPKLVQSGTQLNTFFPKENIDLSVLEGPLIWIAIATVIVYIFLVAHAVLVWSRTYYLSGPTKIVRHVYGIPFLLADDPLELEIEAIDSVSISQGRVRSFLFHYGTVYISIPKREENELGRRGEDPLDKLRKTRFVRDPQRFVAATGKSF